MCFPPVLAQYFGNTVLQVFFAPFRSKARYFALWMVLRRLAIAIIVGLVPAGTLYRDILIVLIFLITAYVILLQKPYLNEDTNDVDVIAQGGLIICYVVGLLVDETSSLDRRVVAAIIFVVAVIAVIVMIAYNIIVPVYRVLFLGQWHDQGERDAALADMMIKVRMWKTHGVHPLYAAN